MNGFHSDSAGLRMDWSRVPSHTQFVGRKSDLLTLQSIFRRGGCLALSGEVGIGKTRLVHEFYHGLNPRPRLLLSSIKTSSLVPYQAITDMLLHSFTAREWKRCEERHLVQLSSLMPELPALTNIPIASSWGVVAEPVTSFYETIHQVLRRMIEPRERALFFLDDAHWCDQASFEVLAYLVNKKFFSEYGLLVLAYCPEIINPHLQDFLEFLEHVSAGKKNHINLSPLSMKEMQALSKQFLGSDPMDELITQLVMQCGGNPLFLMEMLNSILASRNEDGRPLSLEDMSLPGSLQYLIHNHLKNVSPLGRLLLNVAAVIGLQFEPALLAEAAHTSLEETVNGLDELEMQRLVKPVSTEEAGLTYVFVHARIRDVLLVEMSAARRLMLHQQIACALENRRKHAPCRPETLAYHFEAGGNAGKAFQYWVEAGVRATHLYDPRSAIEAFRQAEKWIARMQDGISDDEIYNMYTSWKTAAWESANYDLFAYLCKSLLQIAGQRRSALLNVSALNGIARLLIFNQKMSEALQTLSVIRQYLDELQDTPLEVVRYYCKLALVLGFTKDYKGCLQAWDLAQETAFPWKDADSLHDVVTTEYELAIHFDSIGYLEMVEELHAHSRHNHPEEITPTAMLAVRRISTSQKFFNSANYEFAENEARRGLAAARSQQIWYQCILFHIQISRNMVMMANFDEALFQINTALELIATQGYPEYLMRALYVKGDIFRYLGNHERAREYYNQALKVEGGGDRNILETRLRIAILDNFAGNFAISLPVLREVLEKSRPFEFSYLELLAQLALGEGEALCGNTEIARQYYEEAIEKGNNRSIAFPPIFAHFLLGNLAFSQNRLMEAEREIRFAIEQLQRYGFLLEVEARLSLYKILRKKGEEVTENMWQPIQSILTALGTRSTHPDLQPSCEHFCRSARRAFEEIIQS